MVIRSDLEGLSDAAARRALGGLPRSDYEVVIKPLRYRTSPHLAGRGLRFAWASESVSFRLRREVLRFLYCHEWMHWYLKEVLGKRSAAETACDRFALRNFRRPRVSAADADAALRRRARARA